MPERYLLGSGLVGSHKDKDTAQSLDLSLLLFPDEVLSSGGSSYPALALHQALGQVKLI